MRLVITLMLAGLIFSGCASIEPHGKAPGAAVLRIGSPVNEGVLSTDQLILATIGKEDFTFPKSDENGRIVPAGPKTLEVIWTNTTNRSQAGARAYAKIAFTMKAGRTYFVYAKKLDQGSTILFWVADSAHRQVGEGVVAQIHYGFHDR